MDSTHSGRQHPDRVKSENQRDLLGLFTLDKLSTLWREDYPLKRQKKSETGWKKYSGQTFNALALYLMQLGGRNKLWRYFGQRQQHKGAFEHARVGQL